MTKSKATYWCIGYATVLVLTVLPA